MDHENLLSLSSLTAVILVGGLGTRLRTAVSGRPKVLAEVRGRPFLAYLLDQLVAAGLQQVVLCTGYLGEQVQASFGSTYRGLRLAYSQEPAPLGTGGAIRLAQPLILSETALVLNGDSYCDTDLSDFWHWHRACDGEATLRLANVPDTARYGGVQVGVKGQVVRFSEKGITGNAGWINSGIYLLGHSFLNAIPEGRPVSLEHEIFPAWVGRGLYAYEREGRFLDIGTPESYLAAETFFARCQPTLLTWSAYERQNPCPSA